MTLSEIEAYPEEFLPTALVAEYMKASPNTISAAIAYGQYPFAYKSGKNNMIPKRAFVEFHRRGAVMEVKKEIFPGPLGGLYEVTSATDEHFKVFRLDVDKGHMGLRTAPMWGEVCKEAMLRPEGPRRPRFKERST